MSTDRMKKFRIAIRRFAPFESGSLKQWQAFDGKAGTGLDLDAHAFELDPLRESLFAAGGLIKGDWDVAFISTDWIAEAANAGALLDLSSRIVNNPPEGYPEAWPQSLLEAQNVGGKILGLPYHDGPECLIYRKDLSQNTQPPATWDEYHAVARKLTRPDRKLYGTVFAAFPDRHNTVYDFCLQLWSRGGELFDSAGVTTLNTTAGVEALRWYRAIVNDRSAVHPKCREFDSVASGLAFTRGEAAMMINWFGFAAMCEARPESKVKGRVAVAPLPGVSLNSYWILGMSPASPHIETAWRFLRHCASPEMDKLLTLEGGIGCRKSTWNDPEVNAIVPFYSQLDSLHRNARTLPRLACWPELASVLDEMIIAALDSDVQESVLLKNAEQKMDRILAKSHDSIAIL